MALQTILYVEDEETDVLLFQLALKKAQIRNPLQTAAHAEEAVAYLSGSDPFHDREKYPLPGLVLLDVNLPGRSGLEVLQWIRQQAHFARVPVVIYTSSGAPKDRKQAKELGGDDYIVKPCRLGQMAATLRKLKEQWLA